ncbi:hypothetical protein TB1_016307 [Malus domestica]
MDDEIGHVSNQVSKEANVEKHIEDAKNLLPKVDRMQVAISNGGESDSGPVDGIRVTQPDASVVEVVDLASNPCVLCLFVMGCHPEVEAT